MITTSGRSKITGKFEYINILFRQAIDQPVYSSENYQGHCRCRENPGD